MDEHFEADFDAWERELDIRASVELYDAAEDFEAWAASGEADEPRHFPRVR